MLIRPVQPADKALFAESWEHFGEESRYRRFLGAKGDLSARDLAYFTEVDHVDHEAIGARDAETGAGVGVARYVRRARQPAVAEAAVTVVDAWQGRGLGGELLRRLTAGRASTASSASGAVRAQPGMLALFEEARRGPGHERGDGGRSRSTSSSRATASAASPTRSGLRPRASCACGRERGAAARAAGLGRRGFLLAAAALALGAPDAAAQPARDWAVPSARRAGGAGRARCASWRGGCAGPCSATHRARLQPALRRRAP